MTGFVTWPETIILNQIVDGEIIVINEPKVSADYFLSVVNSDKLVVGNIKLYESKGAEIDNLNDFMLGKNVIGFCRTEYHGSFSAIIFESPGVTVGITIHEGKVVYIVG